MQQVIKMMSSMKVKGEKALRDEQETYEAYVSWFKDRTRNLGYEIEDGDTKVEELSQDVNDSTAKVEKLTQEVTELQKDIGQAESDAAEAKEAREKEHAEFVALQRDQKESADALQRAITELQRPGASSDKEALLQQFTAANRGVYQSALSAYLQVSDHGSALRTTQLRKKPHPKVLDLMKDLREKFREERLATDKAETTKEHDYQMYANRLALRVENAKKDKEDKEMTNATVAAELAKSAADLAEAKDDLAETQRQLRDVNQTFRAKSVTFKHNVEDRKEEIDALGKAIDAINSVVGGSALLSVREARRTDMLPEAAPEEVPPSSFLQTDRERRTHRMHDRLSASAVTSAASEPLKKVIKLIKKMHEEKKDQLKDMTTKKAWCDTEMAVNGQKLNETSDNVKEQSARVEELEAHLEDMQENLKKLAEARVALTQSLANATAQRKREKAENEATLAEAKEGTEAVEKAISILGGIYGRPGESDESESLLQVEGSQPPKMEKYEGMDGASKGVMGMLELIQSDMHRLRAETTATEDQSKREYEELSTDLKSDLKRKELRREHLTRKSDEEESEVANLKDDLAASQDGLKEAQAYARELEAACEFGNPMTYEERQAKRQEEIDSLKRARQVLSEQSGGS